MAKAYGKLPSEMMALPLGDLGLVCDVYGVATGVENALERGAAEDPKNGRKLVWMKLTRDAQSEALYEERKRRGDES